MRKVMMMTRVRKIQKTKRMWAKQLLWRWLNSGGQGLRWDISNKCIILTSICIGVKNASHLCQLWWHHDKNNLSYMYHRKNFYIIQHWHNVWLYLNWQTQWQSATISSAGYQIHELNHTKVLCEEVKHTTNWRLPLKALLINKIYSIVGFLWIEEFTSLPETNPSSIPVSCAWSPWHWWWWQVTATFDIQSWGRHR